MLRLALLGTPEVTLQGRSLLDQLAGRGLALVVYLAVTGQSHTRGRLADLLWHDVSNEEALKKLRNLLPRVRPLLASHLQIGRESLAFDKSSLYWLDVDVLRTHLSPIAGATDPQVLENVLGLYRDDFGANLALRDAPVFEEWVMQQREDLHRLVVQGFHRLADYHLKQGNYPAGLAATQRLLTIEPWREEAHRQQMLLLGKQGERTAALTQFNLCQRVLADEFGIEPATETVLLYEQLRGNVFEKSLETQKPITLTATMPTTHPAQANWDEIPRPLRFYGRESELQTLGQWVNQEGCRLVGLFGLGGQGKSALMAHWLRTHYDAAHALSSAATNPPDQPEPAFAHILWCSLSTPPPVTKLLQEWLIALSGGQSSTLPTRFERQLALLLTYLRQQRCLLVLDNLEQVLPNSAVDAANEIYAGYAELLHGLATGDHQSCLVVISQQRPLAFTRWEEHTPAIRSFHLQGLSDAASRQLLSVYGVTGPACHTLARRYAGCPLALIVAAETTQELFAGNTEHFINAKIWISADLHTRLNQQFVALGATEQTILLWLALAQTPLSFDALSARLGSTPSKRLYLDACRALLHRSLLETHPEGFVLPNLLSAYLTDYLVEGISQELVDNGRLQLSADSLLNRYRLLDSDAPLAIQEHQSQLLLHPILETLLDHWGLPGLIVHLQARLAAWLALEPEPPGYAQVNLHFLLLQLEVTPQMTKKSPGSLAIFTPPLGLPKAQTATTARPQMAWLLAANYPPQAPKPA